MFQKPSRRGGRCDARHISSCRNHFCIFCVMILHKIRIASLSFLSQRILRLTCPTASVVSTFETSYRTVIASLRHVSRKAKAAAAEKTLKDMMHRVVGPVVVAFCIFENLHSLRANAHLSATTTAANENRCCPRRADSLIVGNQHHLEDLHHCVSHPPPSRLLTSNFTFASFLQSWTSHQQMISISRQQVFLLHALHTRTMVALSAFPIYIAGWPSSTISSAPSTITRASTFALIIEWYVAQFLQTSRRRDALARSGRVYVQCTAMNIFFYDGPMHGNGLLV